jgi:hypothetical protein
VLVRGTGNEEPETSCQQTGTVFDLLMRGNPGRSTWKGSIVKISTKILIGVAVLFLAVLFVYFGADAVGPIFNPR